MLNNLNPVLSFEAQRDEENFQEHRTGHTVGPYLLVYVRKINDALNILIPCFMAFYLFALLQL